jgi:hypothetical protein
MSGRREEGMKIDQNEHRTEQRIERAILKIHGIIQRAREEKNAPLVDQAMKTLRKLQHRAAEIQTGRFKRQLPLKPGEGYATLERARKKLEAQRGRADSDPVSGED